MSKRLRIEKDLWSPKSRGGLDEFFAGEFYEDQSFICRACGRSSVFTAEQQKYTYEVKKALIHQKHVLCENCFKRRYELIAESRSFVEAWARDKRSLKGNRADLRRWRKVLEKLPTYGVRHDTARIRMLTRLLENAS